MIGESAEGYRGEVIMTEKKHYKFYEWDQDIFVLPYEYSIDDKSDLAKALKVFYLAGGYDFFNVEAPEYYSSKWLDFVGNLYKKIADGIYRSSGAHFIVPLSEEQKRELLERGVPEIFITDIE